MPTVGGDTRQIAASLTALEILNRRGGTEVRG